MGVSEKKKGGGGGAEMAVKARLIPPPFPTGYIRWMKGPFFK